MAVVYKIRKPVCVDNYDLSLPCYFRRIFGVSWDILYGLLAVVSFILSTWFELDRNYYILLVNTYFDLVIIFDASLSLFIRFYQSIQVIAVNPYIEAIYIALWNMFGFLLDLSSCLPYVFLLFLMGRENSKTVYQMVCLLRFGRLYMTARRYFDKSKTWNFIAISSALIHKDLFIDI